MSNIPPSMDRLHNPLTNYPPSSPSLLIWFLPPSSSSMHPTKANREIADSPDLMAGFLDSKTQIKTTRRNALMVLGVERINSSGKARQIKCLPLLLPMTILSLDSLPLQNLQTVSTSQIPLQTFQRTYKRLCTQLLHSHSVLLPLRKLLASSHLLSRLLRCKDPNSIGARGRMRVWWETHQTIKWWLIVKSSKGASE